MHQPCRATYTIDAPKTPAPWLQTRQLRAPLPLLPSLPLSVDVPSIEIDHDALEAFASTCRGSVCPAFDEASAVDLGDDCDDGDCRDGDVLPSLSWVIDAHHQHPLPAIANGRPVSHDAATASAVMAAAETSVTNASLDVHRQLLSQSLLHQSPLQPPPSPSPYKDAFDSLAPPMSLPAPPTKQQAQSQPRASVFQSLLESDIVLQLPPLRLGHHGRSHCSKNYNDNDGGSSDDTNDTTDCCNAIDSTTGDFDARNERSIALPRPTPSQIPVSSLPPLPTSHSQSLLTMLCESVEPPSRCAYRKGKCREPCTRKRNGALHTFCAFHRARSIANQRNFDARRRRGRDSGSDGVDGGRDANDSERRRQRMRSQTYQRVQRRRSDENSGTSAGLERHASSNISEAHKSASVGEAVRT